MKTYAESVGKEPFNWLEELSTPVETWSYRKPFILADLSREWPTCACGNQCDVIPRRESGCPIDAHLRFLGKAFHEKIQKIIGYGLDEYRKEALETFHAIEVRSAELIKELTK